MNYIMECNRAGIKRNGEMEREAEKVAQREAERRRKSVELSL